MIRKTLLLLFFYIPVLVYAQELSKSDKKIYKRAVDLLEKDRYKDALDQFDELGVTNNPDVNYYTGLTYFYLRDLPKATEYLLHAKLYRTQFQDVDYYIGRSLHLQHEFERALSFFEDHKKSLNEGQRQKIAEAETYITYCRNGMRLIEKPVEVVVQNLDVQVNTEFPEYNPVISADESFIVFTSRRPDSKGGKLDPRDLQYYEDIYISHKDSNGVWSLPESIGNRINSDNHDASIGMSADGQHLLIYRAASRGGDVYISNLDGEEWSSPKNLGKHVNSDYWESSASIASNNRIVFFSSNRKGGVGGTDIYMAKRDSATGEFGDPVLLGPQVNTPGDEIAPFIHADGQTLYFSSRSHLSMGGFDIFSVKVDAETGEILSNAENIGYPINTADDDFNFVWSADNSRAYFSSVRPEGRGEKDIYVLERNIALSPLIVWKGTVVDCLTDLPVNATITVSDNKTKETIGVYTPNKSTGKYTVILPAGRNYNIAVEAPFYAFYSKNIDIPNLDSYKEIEEEICLEPIIEGTTITLRNIFFDFDKATLRKESELELERLFRFMNDYPDIKVEIAGHTDSEGEDDYNMKLSAKRAEAVFNYLLGKGILKSRLKSKGYGETQPIATNDTPEGRQLNRRTAVTIIK